MTIEEFDNLDLMDQYEAIRFHGVLLTERKDDYYTYKLFQLDNFYIERLYCHKEYNIIHGQFSFSPEEDFFLDPYLALIKPNI